MEPITIQITLAYPMVDYQGRIDYNKFAKVKHITYKPILDVQSLEHTLLEAIEDYIQHSSCTEDTSILKFILSLNSGHKILIKDIKNTKDTELLITLTTTEFETTNLAPVAVFISWDLIKVNRLIKDAILSI